MTVQRKTQGPKCKLVYIAGAGRSGSTLLDLLLNNSPQVQSVGEVQRLSLYARTNAEPCTCGKPILECDFWLKVQEEGRKALEVPSDAPLLETKDPLCYQEQFGKIGTVVQKALLLLGNRFGYELFVRTFAKPRYEAALNSLFWYEMVRRASGCPIILDSTKDASRLKILYLTDPKDFKLIYLVRDGRAVAASTMRRENVDMRTAARRWVYANRRSLAVQWSIPAAFKMRVKYEELCLAPEDTLRRICDFIGITYDSRMLVMNKHDSHNIAGNPMRFRKGETKIRLDDRWREQLSAENLRVFARIAGRWNRKLGYDDTT
jgi:hypothetical protein